MNPAISYRKDIDGLRAIAVLAVILFHFNIWPVTGGFIGVDVFFVISGFLITSIIVREIEQKKFSFWNFYERRARRILPMSILITALCIAVGWILLLPSDYEDFAKSAIATSLSISNMFFIRNTGYFSTIADEKPLLHTWSLGVEEQFYIVLPVLLLFLFKFLGRDKSFYAICALSALSLLLAEFLVHREPTWTFYMLPTRAWELGLGSILAFMPRKDMAGASATRTTIAGIGFLLILAPVLMYDKETVFPGIHAIPPVLGAALIIGTGATFVHRFLSTGPMVFVGKISYSLYLWHWPVLAFLAYRFEHTAPPQIYAAAFIGIFLASYLSWKYIETPFRNKAFLSRKAVYALSCAALGAICFFSWYIYSHDGLKTRFDESVIKVNKASLARNPLRPYCHSSGDFVQDKNPKCFIGNAEKSELSAILWGDSHADSVSTAISAYLKNHDLKGMQASKSSCPPLLGDYSWSSPYPVERCHAYNTQVIDYLRRNENVKYVFLGARWNWTVESIRDNQTTGRVTMERALRETADKLREMGKTVFFIGPVPYPDFNVPRCLSKQLAFNDKKTFPCAPQDSVAMTSHEKAATEAFKTLSSHYPVAFPRDALCSSTNCEITHNGIPIYYDDDHLTADGALLLEPAFEKAFNINKERQQ